MKSFKKLFSVVVALVLCFAMALPTFAAASDTSFSDVESGAWYTTGVERWAEAGLIEGPGDGTFGTNNEITRAEVAAIMQRLLGLDAADQSELTFTDVTEDDWFYDEVMSCAAAGVLNGYGDGTFGPNDSITREQAFTMVMRSLLTADQLEATDKTVLDKFTDKGDISSYAVNAVAAIVGCEAVNGYADGTVKPLANITRAEFATILNRLIAVYVYTGADGSIAVSTFEPSHASEVDLAGAGFIVIHSSQDDISVTYEVKTVNDETVKAVVIVATENGVEVTKEVTITTKSDDIVIVHGQEESVSKGDIKDGETLVVEKHDVVEVYDNCAAGGKLVETCEVCGDKVVATLDPKTHEFDEDGICTDCGMDENGNAVKFNLKVSSNDNYVEANVTNDYAATLTVTPGKVSASEVTLSATMQDVASLGGGTRHHEDTFTTNMTGDPSLSTWLSNVFTFEEGYIEVTGLGDEMIGYTLTGTPQVKGEDGFYPEAAVITATPYDVQDTRDAWAELTSHVETDTQEASDSYVNIANGSYMIVGDDKLCFEKGTDEDLKLDNFSDLGAMEDEIRSKVQLITSPYFAEVAEKEGYEAKFYLAAGTELAVSNSIATLVDDCTITVSGEGLNSADFQDVLTNIRDAETTYDMAAELVNMINAMVGSADGETIYVDFDFTTPVEKSTKFYLGMTANNADGNGTTTVDMEVYDDYSLEINLPMNDLSAKEVTLNVSMTDVASLGTAGVTKSHTQTISTGMNATGKLTTWMSNAPLFETATINATIVGADGTTEACTYVLESDMDPDWVTVTGTTDTEAARAAWHLMMEYVDTYDNPKGDDSYIEIASTSYLTIGKETLKFEAIDNLVLDNFSDIAAIKENIKSHVQLVTAEESTLEAYVGAGTKLAVSSSVARLTANALIEITVTDEDGNLVSFDDSTVLSELRADSSSNEELVKDLFGLLNEMVGTMNNATVDVTITFDSPEAVG